MAGIVPLETPLFANISPGPQYLCQTYKYKLSLADQFCVLDLTRADNARFGLAVDDILRPLCYRYRERITDFDQRLARSICHEVGGREYGFLALVWRLQIQSIIVLAFVHLHAHGLIKPTGLEKDIDFERFGHSRWRVWHVQEALKHFQFAQMLKHPPRVLPSSQRQEYEAPLTWLACMIVRGARTQSTEAVISTLEHIGIFGSFNRASFRPSWPVGLDLRRNRRAMIPEPDAGVMRRHWGFYLPTGLQNQALAVDALSEVCTRNLEVWRLFIQYFGLDRRETISSGARIIS